MKVYKFPAVDSAIVRGIFKQMVKAISIELSRYLLLQGSAEPNFYFRQIFINVRIAVN